MVLLARVRSYFDNVYFKNESGHDSITKLCMILTKHRLVRHLTHTLHMSDTNNKKATNRAKHLCTISFLGSSESEIRLIKQLKHVKKTTGVEIKAQILRGRLESINKYQ